MAERKEVTFVPSLDWDVVSQKISLFGDDKEIPNYQALKRSDNGNVISVFKKSYNPLYNKDFVEKTKLISQVSNFEIEGYQEINGGKRVLAYLRNSDPNFKLVGQKVDDYLVVGNSHDGTTSLFLGNSTTIIRCMNQFGTIVQNMKIRHSSKMEEKLDDIISDLEDYFLGVKRLNSTFERFTEIKISPEIITALTQRLFDMDNFTDASPKKLEKVADFKASITQEMDALGSNFWGLFNGVTHYTTHKTVNRNPTKGNFWGMSGEMNNKALKFGEDLLNGNKKVLITV